MAHTHSVIDDDLHFIIDPSTREIGNGSQKVKLMQYDHNSEQFTFEIPRFVEGHDMSLSNSIRVNYININKSTREQHPGVYEVSDIQVEEDNIIFSWLVSRNATQYVGPLNFLIKFMCFDENDYITYEWHTDIFKSASVSTGMNNEESIEEVYPDILEKWKNDVLAEEASRITAESERVAAESERANTFAGYETEINQFKNEIVTGKDSATDNTKFAIGEAEQNLEIPTMEEFNQLAEDMTGKLTEPAEGLAVGKYFRVAALDENGHAVLEAVDAAQIGVQDVTVNGESIVKDSVADIKANGYGIGFNNVGLYLASATNNQIAARLNSNVPLTPTNYDYAVKAAMCDGNGAAWTAEEQAAARERMGLDNWILLADITLDEEVSTIIIPNSKKIKELSIFGTIYASSDAFGGNVGIYCGNYLINCLNSLPNSGAKWVNAITRYAGGFYSGQVNTFDINSGSYSHTYTYTYRSELQDIASADLRLYQLNNKKIGIGTNFKIWILEA